MLWTPAEQDTNPSGPRILDTFVASGRPFEESLAKTSTPRALQSEKLKSGRWDIGEPAAQQGQREIFCEGTFVIQKTIVETTPGVRQVTKYEGDLRVKECFGKKYHRAEPGHFARGQRQSGVHHEQLHRRPQDQRRDPLLSSGTR